LSGKVFNIDLYAREIERLETERKRCFKKEFVGRGVNKIFK